ncbi:DUF4916 domain-containing protein [Arcanobacterium hippocoleae]|uniref:ADP-ribose pyrophosphatase YjhB (NUDIX family) n=1 Tax=Arcanobacterium hippocoleae TaxID=149017 RepID=A0ABU1SZT1_9ACTO|nr:DUF4916 domain-containing protein [Arcanobacterium hippocoleae]MDR6938561.1 ADP-ribose pyrophosphatase YjhB (NUDIX family) [Arcanobacterium hippocoleae]
MSEISFSGLPTPENSASWLSPEELEFVRNKMPVLYVDIVPVKLDPHGELTAVGLLLCSDGDVLQRTIPRGRVLMNESILEALLRHIQKDLGPMALPQLPVSALPFTIGEYFPTPGEHLYDPRQHAVSLAYIVPMAGDCAPNSNAIEFSWFTPGEIRSESLQAEICKSQGAILKRAMAYLGN